MFAAKTKQFVVVVVGLGQLSPKQFQTSVVFGGLLAQPSLG
jgi:hypothetical protein